MHVPGISINDGRITGTEEHLVKSKVISDLVSEQIQTFFNEGIKLVNFGYVQMLPGANNGLHADVSLLDGSPYPDGRHVDYSAILYVNTMDKDFSGGSIAFPNQGVTIRPKAGTLVLFPGDMNHLHSVKTVSSGIRKNIILFFAKQ